ncbi:F-box protein [Trueperella pecoris]|uniref:F-box protein n=1 Tax=Trueperella pecoris TaxID=2733571 RepID=A0A7M1R0J9_9ACTO|nr:F-box protein [Trueperella pecoris]QOR47601.1 F-box protein [Trueperella pecoris]
MATRSEILQAIRELAFLDPTSLLKAAQTSADWLTAAWDDVLPKDATMAEIISAGRTLHAEHPSWEIRAGDVAHQIRVSRREKEDAKRRQAGYYSTLPPESRDGCVPMPAGWKQDLLNKINRKENSNE